MPDRSQRCFDGCRIDLPIDGNSRLHSTTRYGTCNSLSIGIESYCAFFQIDRFIHFLTLAIPCRFWYNGVEWKGARRPTQR